tara:strand:- start:5926 stop:7080 length:1155 start_codon:yes stop_codon:yes gene_type:complete
MKISKTQLTKMVNEEIQQMVDEGFFGKMGHKMGFETGETKRIDSLLMQVARALEEATGDYGLDLDYEDDPVQAVSDFVDRIGGLFMRAGLPEKDFAEAKELMMQGRGEAGANIMYQHFTGMRRTPKGDEARGIIANKLRDIGEEIGKAEEILSIRYKNKMAKEREAAYEKEQAAADARSWWGKGKVDGPRWVGDKKEKVPHGRASSAVGSANLAYGEGKITKAGLRKFIGEVRNQLNEDDVQLEPGGNWGQPLPGEEEAGMVDVESLAMDIVNLLQGVEHNDAVDALTLAAETLGLAPPEEEPKRPIGFREGKSLPPHWLEQGIKADPLCDEKVPDGASMGEYKKCLKNPAAYQRPERRSLEESLRHKLLEESLKRALTNALKK